MSSTDRPRLSVRDRIAMTLGRLVFIGWVRFICWSSKSEVKGRENIDAAVATGRPIIFCIWHGSIASGFVCRYVIQLPRFVGMVSRSRDGEIAAYFAEAFGAEAVRASSSRGGAAGLLQYIRRLQGEGDAAGARAGFQILDGPRGPRGKAKPGILPLARKSNALIVPVVMGVARRWVARSWDRHRVPLPFGRLAFLFGRPIDIVGERGDSPRVESEGGELVNHGDHDHLIDRRGPEFTTENIEAALRALEELDPLCRRDAALP